MDILPLVATVAEMGLKDVTVYPFKPDLIEAQIRCGKVDEAEHLLQRFEAEASALARPSAVAAAARCRALVSAAKGDFATAMTALEKAFDAHRRSGQPFELARTRLVAGEIHRRRKHRQLARAALGEALEMFEQLGARLWVDATRLEIARIPGRRPRPESETLTATEQQIAELVSVGMTNREVAAELFLSVHTIEANLRRVYRKLGVRSRTELAARRQRAARDEI